MYKVIDIGSKSCVNLAFETLQKGRLVVFPCETVYGIAVDCLNTKAVAKLNSYKQRPLGKPYAIMASSQKMAEDYIELNETAKNLYKTFLPGPMTVVSKGKHKVADGIESETGTIGVRIPDYPFMLRLIEKFGHPIVATSANVSYQKRPYKISDILNNLSEKQKSLIDLIIDAGELPHREPSTVVDTTFDDPVILRQGDIKLKDKNEILSGSPEATKNLGKEIWQKYEQYLGKRAIVFALEGPMGAGKTQFTKGLARAMGIKEEVISPTYNLEEIYENKLFHIDAWRMENPEELANIGFSKSISDKSVVAIEWAERVADEIRKYNEEAVIVWVKIEYGKAENERLVSWGIV
jgi:L-threonylcarbamoyladenylate synthase